MIRKQGDFTKGDNEENQHGCAPIVVWIDHEKKENN
jgi:hypothetical protein